jgi:hypothetical protein
LSPELQLLGQVGMPGLVIMVIALVLERRRLLSDLTAAKESLQSTHSRYSDSLERIVAALLPRLRRNVSSED